MSDEVGKHVELLEGGRPEDWLAAAKWFYNRYTTTQQELATLRAQLQAERERVRVLEEALWPFARTAQQVVSHGVGSNVFLSDFTRAHDALHSTEAQTQGQGREEEPNER